MNDISNSKRLTSSLLERVAADILYIVSTRTATDQLRHAAATCSMGICEADGGGSRGGAGGFFPLAKFTNNAVLV